MIGTGEWGLALKAAQIETAYAAPETHQRPLDGYFNGSRQIRILFPISFVSSRDFSAGNLDGRGSPRVHQQVIASALREKAGSGKVLGYP
jgi:hypothetical protein